MDSEEIFHTFAIVIFIVLGLIKTIFSLTIVIIISSNWNRKCRSILNLHVCNSCISSLFYVFAVSTQIPLLFEITYQENHYISLVFCEIRGFIFLTACAIKSYSYLVQTISRYFITVHHKRVILLTFRFNLTMIFISWIAALLVTSISFRTPFAYRYEPDSHLCVITSKIFSISFYPTIFIFLIPMIIIIWLYGSVLWHTTHSNRIHPMNISMIRTKRHIKVFRNILINLTVLIIGAAPYFISIIINSVTAIPQIFHLISTIFISMSNTFELIAIFFTNENVKTIFYIKIGWHHEPSNNIPMRRNRGQCTTII